MPGTGMTHGHGSPEMRYCSMKNKIEIVELSDLHHPNCKIARQASAERDVPRHDSESSDTVYMTPEAYKATEAVEFIAEHLRNEEEYIQVSIFFFLNK